MSSNADVLDFPGTPPAEASPQIGEAGYVVIRDAIDTATLASLRQELAPYLEGALMGRNDFEGYRSERVYSLLRKSPSVAALVEHPAVLAVCDALLHPTYLLSAALVVNLHPGETAQGWHQDDALGAGPPPRAPQGVSTIWAIDDFTRENGATDVIPGSHRWDHAPPSQDEMNGMGVSLEMPAGSVAIFPGNLFHRGGANLSSRKRFGMTIQYCQPWLRQLENMMLAHPPEVARRFSERIQRLIGYELVRGTFVGYVDGRHPSKLLR